MPPLETATFEGAPRGVDLANPAHALSPGFARYLQDVLLDEPEILRRRGPIRVAPGTPDIQDGSATRAFGIVGTYSPANVFKVAVIARDKSTGATELFLLSDDLTSVAGLINLTQDPGGSPTNIDFGTSVYPIFDAKPALNGGVLIGMSDKYGLDATKRILAFWRGAGKPTYNTNPNTITVSQGSTSVTGAGTGFTSNVEPGMFLFKQDGSSKPRILVGAVKSVESNTALTLEQPALEGMAAVPATFKSIRGLNPRITTGRITVASGSTTVNGGDTKWKDQGMVDAAGSMVGLWAMYRAEDMKFIGNVSSVTSNTQLVLAAGSTVGLADARYVLIQREADYSVGLNTAAPGVGGGTPPMGFLSAVWQGTQFLANTDKITNQVNETSRVDYSDQIDFESFDPSVDDGSYFDMPSSKPTGTPIRALAPANNAMLVIKEDETYGIFGSGPDSWRADRLEDDGTISTMSVVSHDGGVVWAGKRGIYAFDGTQVRNLVQETLGQWYIKLVETFNPEANRAWALVERDHYKVFIEAVTPPSGITKGASTTTPTRMTISVNLRTGAVTFHTNVDIRGSLITPGSVGKGTLFVVERDNAGVRTVSIADARNLFADSGSDSLTSWGNTAGPDFYWESAKWDAEDSQLKKLFKFIKLHHWNPDGQLKFDVIPGMNDAGTTSTAVFSAVTSFVNSKIKFLKRSQFIAFRVWEDPADRPSKVRLGPWSIGFKRQRPSKV